MWVRALIAIALWTPPGAYCAQPAHSKEAQRLLARATASEQKGDYWQALRDAEAVLRVDAGWAEAQRLRRNAGYQAHYNEALRLIDSADWKNAADQLENARVYGNTPELSAKVRLVRAQMHQEEDARAAAEQARAAALAALNEYLASVTQALAAGDWRLADRRIRHLPAIPEPVPVAAHGDLLPAFQAYARGQIGEARTAATAHRDAAAESFLLFLNSRARQERVPVGLGLMGALYAAALLASIYWGLRRELEGRVA